MAHFSFIIPLTLLCSLLYMAKISEQATREKRQDEDSPPRYKVKTRRTTQAIQPLSTRRVRATPYNPPPTPPGEPRYVAPSLRFFDQYEVRRVPFVGALYKDLFDNFNDVSIYDWLPGHIPSFCGQRWCPPFKVVCKNEFYEVRQYVNITLVSAIIDAQDYKSQGLGAGYDTIYAYFKGDNKEYIKLPLTFPVGVNGPLLQSTSDEDFLYNLIKGGPVPGVSLPIGPPYDTYPPQPLSPKVKISYIEGPLVYVNMFGGEAFSSIIVSKAETFLKVLRLNGQKTTGEFEFKRYSDQYSDNGDLHNEIHVPVIGVEKPKYPGGEYGEYHHKPRYC